MNLLIYCCDINNECCLLQTQVSFLIDKLFSDVLHSLLSVSRSHIDLIAISPLLPVMCSNNKNNDNDFLRRLMWWWQSKLRLSWFSWKKSFLENSPLLLFHCQTLVCFSWQEAQWQSSSINGQDFFSLCKHQVHISEAVVRPVELSTACVEWTNCGGFHTEADWKKQMNWRGCSRYSWLQLRADHFNVPQPLAYSKYVKLLCVGVGVFLFP